MNDSQFLYLVSGEKEGEGFWEISFSPNADPLNENKYFLECYRKELIGIMAAKEILKAIEMNIENLLDACRSDGYKIKNPVEGISYDLPLTVLEEIYDFWIDLYAEPNLFERVLSLLITRKKINFSHPSIVKGLKGFSGEWAQKIEKLHSYRPSSKRDIFEKEPMWAENNFQNPNNC
ncbi:josephin [Prochlorococcus sp. MIT 0603]|uniref:josephin n=1 Tax=Prochlorococcus sp. MIT 0603 TaxID=1499500 RepID=UPI001269678C|nr:josephin [Prochlorococcus sp. MIT 0603]